MSRLTIAVLHHQRSFFPLDLFAQVHEIADLVWVFSEPAEDGAGPPRLPKRLGPVLDISALSLDAAADAIGRYEPDGIVTFVDDTLVLTAELAQLLALPFHTPAAARQLVDKRLQRAAFDAAGIPGPGSWALNPGETRTELEAIGHHLPYPCVVKPAEGSGSRGIDFITEPSDLLGLLSGDRLTKGYLLEEYLLDDPDCAPWIASYVSVESIVTAERISHATVTGRFPLAPPFRETGNIVPAAIAPDLLAPLLALVERAARALDVRSAVIHTEIKLTPTGPKLIEINGRLGGRPPFVLGAVSDVNLFQTVCQVAAGIDAHVDGPVPCDGVGFWLMIHPPVSATHLAAIDGIDDVMALADVDTVEVFVRPGDPVSWKAGTEARVATVRGRSADHPTLQATIAEIHRLLVLTYVEPPPEHSAGPPRRTAGSIDQSPRGR